MTKQEFSLLAKGLRAAYMRDRFLADDDSMSVWYEMLKDLSYEVASIAAQKYINTNHFPPTIADIREAAVAVMHPEIPNSGDAWQEVLMAVRRFGYYDQQGALESLSPLTRQAAERFGFRELCDTGVDDVGVARGQFMRIYEQVVARHKEDSVMSNAAREAIEMLRQKTLAQMDEKLLASNM